MMKHVAIVVGFFVVSNIEAGLWERIVPGGLESIRNTSELAECYEKLINRVFIPSTGMNKTTAPLLAKFHDGKQFFMLEEREGHAYPFDSGKLFQWKNNLKDICDKWHGNKITGEEFRKSLGDTADTIMESAVQDVDERYLPASLLYFRTQNIFTNPRVGMIGLALSRIAQVSTGNTRIVSGLKKLFGLQALASVSYHTYQVCRYAVPRAKILKKHVLDKQYKGKSSFFLRTMMKVV